MGEKHPNRKKDKYNPYTLIISGGRYYLSFKDSRGELQTIEIDEILYGLRHFGDMVNRTERVAPEPLGKECILLNSMHPSFASIEVAEYFHLSGHGAFGNIEEPVEMQTIGFPAAFPCADIQPTFAA